MSDNYKAFNEDDYFQDNKKGGKRSKSSSNMSSPAQILVTKCLITFTLILSLAALITNNVSWFSYSGPDFSTRYTSPVLPVQYDGVCRLFDFKQCNDTYAGKYSCKNNLPYKDIYVRTPNTVMPENQPTTNAFVFLFGFISVIILFIATICAWIPINCCNWIKRLLFVVIIVGGVLAFIGGITFFIGSGKGTKGFCLNNDYTTPFVATGLEDAVAWRVGPTVILLIITCVFSIPSAGLSWKYLVIENENRAGDDDL